MPRGVPIGFFFHVPFPSSELFRILPNVRSTIFLTHTHSVNLAQRNFGGCIGCGHDWISVFRICEALPIYGVTIGGCRGVFWGSRKSCRRAFCKVSLFSVVLLNFFDTSGNCVMVVFCWVVNNLLDRFGVFPAGISPQKYIDCVASPSVQERVTQLR